jgi:pimeloyl-ACP methyl ester carboxylesterase
VQPQLSETHDVIAPDLLGHGESAKPMGDYSLGAYAGGLRDLRPRSHEDWSLGCARPEEER